MPIPNLDKHTYDAAINIDRKLVNITVHKWKVHDCYGAQWRGWDTPPAIFEWTIKPGDGNPRPRFRLSNPTKEQRALKSFFVDEDGQAWLPYTNSGPCILNNWRVHKGSGLVEVFPGAHDRRNAIEALAKKRPRWKLTTMLYPGEIMDIDADDVDDLPSYRGRWQEARSDWVNMVLTPEQIATNIKHDDLPSDYNIETGLSGLPEWEG